MGQKHGTGPFVPIRPNLFCPFITNRMAQIASTTGNPSPGRSHLSPWPERKEDRKAMLQVYSSNQPSLHYANIKCEIRVPVFSIDWCKCLL